MRALDAFEFVLGTGVAAPPPPWRVANLQGIIPFARECVPVSSARPLENLLLLLSRLQGWRGTRALAYSVWGLALVRFSVFSAVFTMNVCGGGLWIVIACGLYGLDSPRIR